MVLLFPRILSILFLFVASPLVSLAQGKKKADQQQAGSVAAIQPYLQNRAPLKPKLFLELPLGAIKPQGWLKEMLVRQRNGSTGKLDELYPAVMGERNGWLGGDGDQWERGPYWIDGLLPLAYLLNDSAMIAKVKPWVEWSLKSQQPDGYFGPRKDYGPEPGIQRDNSQDWWPKMVMLKILKQYYTATSDKRVLELLANYFRYQLKELPTKPLDHWTFWARLRAGDNLMVIYWLYNITGEKFLLDLADLVHKQTFDFTYHFLETDLLSTSGSIHAVNLAQGMKEPLVYYQQHPEQQYLDAMHKGFNDLTRFNGMAHGMYGGDEALHGNNPTQGSELCSAVEMMFTLETALNISGEVDYADRLERIAFNALPSQTTEDYMARQYFQQANQVMVTRQSHNFQVNHSGTDVCYGLLSGYPCCTSNMHQGWPKFTQNLWYASADSGMAALVYSPSEARIRVADGTEVLVKEQTRYPFNDNIRFTLTFPGKKKLLKFPLYLRIPAWCQQAAILVNGVATDSVKGNQNFRLQREWRSGDVVELILPMQVRKNTWYENSVSVERGPLVYALRIDEEWQMVSNTRDPVAYGKTYYEIRPTSPWNYGLTSTDPAAYRLEEADSSSLYPWNLRNTPLILHTRGRRIRNWELYNEMAGPVPHSTIYNEGITPEPEEEIILVPYGCTKLRISQFPVF